MLRYFACSVRNFSLVPDFSDHRLNWEIWITFNGKVKPQFYDNSHMQIPDGNFWVLPPGARYRWQAETEDVNRAVMHFAYLPVELECLVRARGFGCWHLDEDEIREARGIAEYVGAAYQRRDHLSILQYQRSIYDLALLALKHEPTLHATSLELLASERAERALAWYMEHVYEAPKFEQLAAEMKISASHLRRLFHAHFKKSPKAVFDRVRLERATTLMTSSTATLEEIAANTGFHSISDFCRVFKKHFGHSPNVWRRSVGVVKNNRNHTVSGSGLMEVVVKWPINVRQVNRKKKYVVWPGGNCPPVGGSAPPIEANIPEAEAV